MWQWLLLGTALLAMAGAFLAMIAYQRRLERRHGRPVMPDDIRCVIDSWQDESRTITVDEQDFTCERAGASQLLSKTYQTTDGTWVLKLETQQKRWVAYEISFRSQHSRWLDYERCIGHSGRYLIADGGP